jgi:nitroreductase
MDALEAIRTRRSYGRLTEPAPTDEHLRQILEAGAAAPDHGELRPFRFTILRGAGLDAFGEVLEEAYFRRCTDTGAAPVPAKAQKERSKLGRAPMVIVVSAVRQPSEKIPWIDQRDAGSAATQNILIAAHALGYGAIWRTGAPCEDEYVKKALGLTMDDAILGFVYIGTPHEGKQLEPKVPSLDGLVSEYGA